MQCDTLSTDEVTDSQTKAKDTWEQIILRYVHNYVMLINLLTCKFVLGYNESLVYTSFFEISHVFNG